MDIENMNLKELAEKLVEIRSKKEDISKIEKDLNQQEEYVEARMIDEMINEGQSSVKYAGVGAFTLTTKQFPKIVDDKIFFDYLSNTGQEHMAQYTVNGNTLRSWWNSKVDVELDPETIGLEVFTKTKLSVRRS